MNQFSILMGGTNGYGINDACMMLCRLFSRYGLHVYAYNDFPSVIRGQHQFAYVRAATEKISTHSKVPDVALLLNQEALDVHKGDFAPNTVILSDPGQMPKEMQPACMAATLCSRLGIPWDDLKQVVEKHHPQKAGEELERMKAAYDGQIGQDSIRIPGFDFAGFNNTKTKTSETKGTLPVLNGCQAVSLGLLKTGLRAYTAYPMTPTSPILEYLAGLEKEAGLQVVLPESEIAVIMTALGYSYMGIKNAVGTSGGGFSLMVEGLGLSGMSELPVVVVMGQRAGPSTGMPTYSAQTDLMFVLSAGHGEFARFVVAPGDAEEAYYWSGIAMNKAWKFRMPALVLTDKVLGLGIYDFDLGQSPELAAEEIDLSPELTPGISPEPTPGIAPGLSTGRVFKANSYVHDGNGYARENPEIAKASADDLMKKYDLLSRDLEPLEQVKVYGEGKTALLCWGTNKGVCMETAAKLGMKAVQVLVLSPFPVKAMAKALEGVERVIDVECNAQGQFGMLMMQNGFAVQDKILKYDGRPFALEDLEEEVKKVMK
jgi:2-oxoglutarate ferredoxin oxidoreductase subunit alpha